MAEKYITRYPPCPAYETRRFECWLEDMAKDGWLLSLDFFSRYGFATFRLVTPQTLRFRLQPAPKKAGRFARRNPQVDAVDLAEEYGWHYLGLYDGFFIYYTADSDLPELHTDPQVLALALGEHKKRRRNKFLVEMMIIAAFVGLFLWIAPIQTLLSKPVWYLPMILFTFLFCILLYAREHKHLNRLQQELILGYLPEVHPNKSSRITTHRVAAMAAAAVWILLVLILPVLKPHYHWQPIPEYAEPLPFATVEDLTGGTFSTEKWSIKHNNEVGFRSTLLAGTQFQLVQCGQVFRDDERVSEGALEIDYYEMRTEWLAKRVFQEIRHTASLSRGTYSKYVEKTTPELPVDQAAAYTNYHPTLLLRQGSKILRVRYLQTNWHVQIPLEQWAPVFAASLLD